MTSEARHLLFFAFRKKQIPRGLKAARDDNSKKLVP